MPEPPLAGLRVVELADDTARFAGKLLSEAGASVVQLCAAFPGPDMTDPAAARRGGLLDWWYDGGKARYPVDLGTDGGRDTYRRLAEHADLIVETMPPGRLADLGVDHGNLVAANPALVQVSLTPFGRTGPRAGWQTSDLVAGAMSGALSVSGIPDRAIGAWGRQNLNLASAMACVCALTGLYHARETGRGQLVDVSLHEVMTSTIEHLLFQWWFPDVLPFPRRALRQGSLHWLGCYVVADAKSGACNVAPVPSPLALFEWMVEAGDPAGAELAELAARGTPAEMPRVMDALRRFARTMDSGELFSEAQRRHLAFGEVQSVAQVAANPQLEFRNTFRPVDDFPDVRMPGPFAVFDATPCRPPSAPTGGCSLDQLLGDWRAPRALPATLPDRRHPGPASAGKPLEGLRVVDFTWVLAGPFANRIMGDLGADVLKFQTAARATLVNSPDFPYFYVWNRSKRLLSLDMKRGEALPIIRAIVEQSDVLMENFSSGVLDRWGLGYEAVREWNPQIVYVTMSGPGHEGPWSKVITYAPTIHALCGLTYLSNPPERRDVGPGFSLNDHAAGLLSVVAVLAAVDARRRTGEGQHVDLAQLETGAYLIGPALLDYFANGRESHPVGNADPFGQWCPNEVFRCGDEREVAVTCRTDAEWVRLCETVTWDIGDLARDARLQTVDGRVARADEINERLASWCATRTADAAAAALQANGVPAGTVQDGGDLMTDPQHVARAFFRTVQHERFGERPFDRFPALWSGTDLEPYVPTGSYIGEHNFEVYTELAGLDEETVATGIGDGLFG
jgi:crotonobetainyl-CoA:carnitine CoA-transferase CaiB-like acyl-CoA transferase